MRVGSEVGEEKHEGVEGKLCRMLEVIIGTL
jgi:hypothetical protein